MLTVMSANAEAFGLYTTLVRLLSCLVEAAHWRCTMRCICFAAHALLQKSRQCSGARNWSNKMHHLYIVPIGCA
jgi:hypothetical protein